MTAEEKQALIEGLEYSRGLLHGAVSTVSDSDYHAKPDASRWSIGEIVEHLCLLEYRLPKTVIPKALAGERHEEIDYSKDGLREMIQARDTRVEGPVFVHPQQTADNAEQGLAKFDQLRANTLEYVRTTGDDLRHFRAEHPVFGPLDCYQWLRNLSAHTERHVKQIDELKSAL